jgi:hypothetical protein
MASMPFFGHGVLLRKTPGNGYSRPPVGLKQPHPCRFFAFRSFAPQKLLALETAGIHAGLKQWHPCHFGPGDFTYRELGDILPGFLQKTSK